MNNAEKFSSSEQNPDNPWLNPDLFTDSERPQTSTESLELPTTSTDSTLRFYLRTIEHMGRMGNVKSYLEQALAENPKSYDNPADYLADNPNYENNIIDSFSEAELNAVRDYSGYNYTWINSVMRGFWDYEKMGKKTPELEKRIYETADHISSAIMKAPEPSQAFIAHRGTNLDSFRNYQINSVEELERMQGQFFLEQGFTSTSISAEHSFVGKDFDSPFRAKTDIEIRYQIPAGNRDTIALFSDQLSYSPQQDEVLINHDAISYISKVNQAEDGHYVLDAILIPHAIYEPEYYQ